LLQLRNTLANFLQFSNKLGFAFLFIVHAGISVPISSGFEGKTGIAGYDKSV